VQENSKIAGTTTRPDSRQRYFQPALKEAGFGRLMNRFSCTRNAPEGGFGERLLDVITCTNAFFILRQADC